uniref:Uncharacterized protein n=1 Tax=Acrobeloides nanus TaxID=290746 RepID=A0A914E4N1_9BILA
MGQRISNNSFFKASSINWEEFVQLIKEINIRCIKVKNSGSYISFAVKKGTDETFLWKHTIRICCLKKTENADDGKEQGILLKVFTLSQFLRLCSSLIQLLDTAEAPDPVKIMTREDLMSTSMFEDSCTDEGECVVCLEREPNTVLPFQQKTIHGLFQKCPKIRVSNHTSGVW